MYLKMHHAAIHGPGQTPLRRGPPRGAAPTGKWEGLWCACRGRRPRRPGGHPTRIAAWAAGCRKRHATSPPRENPKGLQNECRGGYQPPAPVGNDRDVHGRILSSPTFSAPTRQILQHPGPVRAPPGFRAAEGGPYRVNCNAAQTGKVAAGPPGGSGDPPLQRKREVCMYMQGRDSPHPSREPFRYCRRGRTPDGPAARPHPGKHVVDR